jgi:hypothetical protein
VQTPHISRPPISLLIASAVFLLPALAAAQADPKFAFTKAEAPVEEKPVEWRVQARAGALATTGNSQAKSATIGLTSSRKAGNNKLAFDALLAYGTTNVVTPVLSTDPAMPNTVTALERTPVTTTNSWLTKGRYDRFLTANNAAYAAGLGGGDKIAGKKIFAGGQVGYSRQLVKDTKNLLVAELGYDFSYEWYVQQPGKTLDPVSVHSLRVFLGNTLTLTETTGITCSAEALFNVNKESKALNAKTGGVGVDPFKDTRLNVKAGLTTTIYKSLSFAFGVTFRYDQNPAPLPVPRAGLVFASGFQPFAQTIDTLSEATLIYTFL